MPRRSKIELSQDTIQELEDKFFDFLSSLNTSETRSFFSEFLTDEEKMMMYKRLALYWSLLEGYPLSKIQQTIGVTHDTTRIYNKKKNTLSNDFKLLLKRITANEEELMAQQPTQEEAKTDEIPMQQQEFAHSTQEEVQPVVEATPEPTPDGFIPIMEETIISEEVRPEFSNETASNDESFEDNTNSMDETSHMQPFEPPIEEHHQDIQASTEDGQGKQNEEPQKKKGGLAKFFGF
jgi:uncharacterized protein YerC